MSSTRDRILDALECVLADTGPAGATLEAVANAAGVSKGGLLYHFGSKEALYGGLLDRLRDFGAQEATKIGEGGVIRSYLEGSSTANDAYTHTVLAVLRLVGTVDLDVEGAVRESLDHWSAVLAAEIDDPLLVRLITLVGDGLYLRALLAADSHAIDAELPGYLERLARGGA